MRPLAIITGASSGIGKAAANELFSNGYDLLLTGRRKDRLAEIKNHLLTQTTDKAADKAAVVETAVFDIQSKSACEAFAKDKASLLERADVLINNAGLALGTEKMQAGKFSDWETMIDTNVKGLLQMTHLVLPHLLKRPSAHIVNLGSVAGRWLYPGGAVYCATKFAVRALTEGLRMDLLGSNVRVSNIEPGMVETEFSLVRMGSKEKADQVYVGMKPLTAVDIAETISWILNRPKHVNIQELVIYPTDQAHVGMVHRRSPQ